MIDVETVRFMKISIFILGIVYPPNLTHEFSIGCKYFDFIIFKTDIIFNKIAQVQVTIRAGGQIPTTVKLIIFFTQPAKREEHFPLCIQLDNTVIAKIVHVNRSIRKRHNAIGAQQTRLTLATHQAQHEPCYDKNKTEPGPISKAPPAPWGGIFAPETRRGNLHRY